MESVVHLNFKAGVTLYFRPQHPRRRLCHGTNDAGRPEHELGPVKHARSRRPYVIMSISCKSDGRISAQLVDEGAHQKLGILSIQDKESWVL